MNLDKFRKNLKMVRMARGLTAKELSELCDLNQKKRISDIEDGRGKPSMDEFFIICDFLRVKIDDMIRNNAETIIKFY